VSQGCEFQMTCGDAIVLTVVVLAHFGSPLKSSGWRLLDLQFLQTLEAHQKSDKGTPVDAADKCSDEMRARFQ
jgi:hypothetical protein